MAAEPTPLQLLAAAQQPADAEATPTPLQQLAAGPLVPGNIDLQRRPVVKNSDGSISTVRSITVTTDRGAVVLPTVSDDGRIMTNQQALDAYRQTGRHLGVFATEAAANAYAQRLHEQQAALYARPRRDMSKLGADIAAAGGERAVGKVAQPEGSFLGALQAAATNAFGVPLAGALETGRDFLDKHPILAAVVDPNKGRSDVPRGLTHELRAKAEQQRADYLQAHPGGLNAAAELGGELGVNVLPMLAGAPAALRALGVAGEAPTIGSATIGALRGAGAGAGMGAAAGYAGSYGEADRLGAAVQGAKVGALMGAVGGAGKSPETPPGAASSEAVATATRGLGEEPPATPLRALAARFKEERAIQAERDAPWTRFLDSNGMTVDDFDRLAPSQQRALSAEFINRKGEFLHALPEEPGAPGAGQADPAAVLGPSDAPRSGGDAAAPQPPQSPPVAEAGSSAGAPEAPRGAVLGRAKPPWEMTEDELRAAVDAGKRDDADLETQIFGSDGAARYRTLQRRANSVTASHAESDAASTEIEQMEQSLSEQQRRRLFGQDLGDDYFTPEELRDFVRARSGLAGAETPDELAAGIRNALTEIGDPSVDPWKMGYRERLAYARLAEAHRVATERGWDTAEVMARAVTKAAARFADPEDRAMMLEHLRPKAAPASTEQLPPQTPLALLAADSGGASPEPPPRQPAPELGVDDSGGTATASPSTPPPPSEPPTGPPGAPPWGRRASEPPPPAPWSRQQLAGERDLYDRAYKIRVNEQSGSDLAGWEGSQIRDQIRQALPDPAVRQDARFYLDGTGNKLVSRTDAPADVEARLNQSGTLPAVQQVLAGLRPQLDALHATINDMGFRDVPYIKDYLHQMWEAPNDIAPPSGGSRFGSSSSTPATRARTVDNLAQGIGVYGLEPRGGVDLADIAGKTHEVLQRTVALHQALDDVSRLPQLPDGMPPVVRGYLKPNNQYVNVTNFPAVHEIAERMEQKGQYPAPDPAVLNQYRREQLTNSLDSGDSVAKLEPPEAPEREPIGKGPNLYMHRQVWTNLRPLLGKYESNAFGKFYDRLNALSKQSTFAFSLYHPLGSLTPNAIMANGPVRGLAMAAKGGFGIPGLAQGMDSFEAFRPGQEMMRNAIKWGYRIPPPETDVGAQGASAALSWAAEKAGQVPGVGPALRLPPAALKRFYDYQNEALWSQHGLRAKLGAYTIDNWFNRAKSYQRFLRGEAGGRPLSLGFLRTMLANGEDRQWLLNASDDDIGRKVAGAATEFFGDQQWNLLQNKLWNDPVTQRLLARMRVPEWLNEAGDPSSPFAQKMLRRAFTAPDWFASSVKAPLTAASPNFVRSAMGMKYIQGVGGMLIGYNLLNHAISGRYMYQNPEGYKTSVDIGPMDPDEPDGKHFYVDVGKQERELLDAVTGKGRAVPGNIPILGTAFRKTGTFPSSLIGAFGDYPTGYPSPVSDARHNAAREQRPFTGPDWMLAASKTIGKGFVPIPFGSVFQALSHKNPKAAAAGLIFPLRTGPNPETWAMEHSDE